MFDQFEDASKETVRAVRYQLSSQQNCCNALLCLLSRLMTRIRLDITDDNEYLETLYTRMNYNYALNGVQKRLFELFQANVAASNGRLVKHRKVIDPIIQALDALKYKTVIKACTKALEKPSPVTSSTLKLLKAVALFFDTDEKSASVKLLRSVCQDETIHGLGDLAILKFLDVLSPLILPSETLVDTCDRAAKAYPDDVDLTLFVLNLLLSRNAFDKASKLALKLHSKRSSAEFVLSSSTPETQLRNSYYRKRYLLIAIAALLMQAKTSPNAMLLDLADAYQLQYTKLKESIDEAVTPSNPPSSQSIDIYGPGRGDVDYALSEFWLRAKALELRSKMDGESVAEKRKELLALFGTPEGEDLRNRHLGLELWARDLVLLYGGTEDLQKLFERLVDGLKDGKDGNWHSINSLVQAAVKLDTASAQNQSNGLSVRYQSQARDLLQGLAGDATIGRERGFTLGLVYLARSESSNLELDLVDQVVLYFERFGSKSCCAADLTSAIEEMSASDKSRLAQTLPSCEGPKTEIDLYRYINWIKIQQQFQIPTAPDSTDRAMRFAEEYFKYLSLGVDLPSTDLQPADDLALFAVEQWLAEANGAGMAQWQECMLKAIALCEHAIKKSPYKFQFRVLLIQLYRLFGAPSLALQHYGLLNPKSIQQDSISHLFTERCSTFALVFAAKPQKGSSTPISDRLEKTLNANASFYHLADRQALETSSRVWNQLTFIKIEEYCEFSQRVDKSVTRAHLAVEQYRQQTLASGVVQDLPREVQDIALATSENRDFTLVPASCRKASAMGPSTGPRWNSLMAKIHWSLFADEGTDTLQSLTDSDLQGAKEELTPAEIAFITFVLGVHQYAQISDPNESERLYKLLGSYFDEASHEIQTALKSGTYSWKVLHTLHLLSEACILLFSIADGQSDLAFIDAPNRKTSKLMKRLKPLANNARTACRNAAVKLTNHSTTIKASKYHEILVSLEEFDVLDTDGVCEQLARSQQAAARDAGKATMALFS